MKLLNFLKFRKSKLFKESAAYTVINILVKVVPFLILPIITRILPKEEVGIYVLYQAVYLIFVPILTLNLQNAVMLNFFKLEKEKFKRYFSNSIVLFFLFFLLITLIIYLFKTQIISIADIPTDAFFILVIIIFSFFFVDLRALLWRNEHKILNFGIFQITLTIVKNVTGLILIYFYDFNWLGIIYGHLVGYSIYALFALFSFKKDGLFKFEFEEFSKQSKDALRISVPLSLHKISAWFGSTVNRIIIADKMGAKFTAKFGIGSTFFTIGTVLFDALNKAYVPALFEKLALNTRSSLLTIRKMIFAYYGVIILITVGLALFGYLTVGIIFGADYENTKYFLVPLTISAGINGLYKIHINFILFQKKTYLILIISLIAGVLNIPIAIYLIVNYGLIGAAYALLITNTIYYILSVILSIKTFKSVLC
ncbi:lipopolysaccharide biosynthesis protein [Psychroflexus aestuariivivens]|uniref:lipopolysaccharide biosynthesis protein n=1 Tax=Psychroflexus aestuariivivens TaxID=1795040 RepID=UPI000FDB347D|nr:oligosaccharide flippase family protein [Psychroflexus aestuariivivens]